MSALSHRIALSAPAARSAVIAALLGTTFLAAPWTTARADDTTAATPPVQQMQAPAQTGMDAAETQVETVEDRIASLHAALKVTPDEEEKWDHVAQSMRENAAAMERLVAERTTKAPQDMTAVVDLKSYEKFTQQHANGLKKLIASFEVLYNSMPDAQKKVADEVFQKFGHRNEPSQH
jgi:hypothetical protein